MNTRIFLPILLFCGFFYGRSQADPVPSARFIKHLSVEQAQDLAARRQRLLLVHFRADWCMPSRWMEEQVLADASVRSLVEGHFLGLQINVDAPVGRSERERYAIRQLPTLLVFSPEGRLLLRLEGMQEKVAFYRTLRALLDNPSASEGMARPTAGHPDPGIGHLHKPALLPGTPPLTPAHSAAEKPLPPEQVEVEVALLEAYREVLELVGRLERRLQRRMSIRIQTIDGRRYYRIVADGFPDRRSAFYFKQQLKELHLAGTVQMVE